MGRCKLPETGLLLATVTESNTDKDIIKTNLHGNFVEVIGWIVAPIGKH